MKEKYRFKVLKDINESGRDSEKNKPEEYDSMLAKAAGEAMNLMNTARNAGAKSVRLDLTMETEKNTDGALLVIALSNLENGMPREECTQDLIEKVSAYELFTLSNLLSTFDIDNEIVLDQEMSKNLMLKAIPKDDEPAVLFDPKTILEDVFDQCFEFVDMGLETPGVKICLDPYKKIVSKDFIAKLEGFIQ